VPPAGSHMRLSAPGLHAKAPKTCHLQLLLYGPPFLHGMRSRAHGYLANGPPKGGAPQRLDTHE